MKLDLLTWCTGLFRSGRPVIEPGPDPSLTQTRPPTTLEQALCAQNVNTSCPREYGAASAERRKC